MKFIFIKLALPVCCCLFAACQSLKVIEKPIVWDDTRKALSVEYLQQRHGLTKARSPYIIPKMVVSHWTAIPTLEGSLRAFQEAKLPNHRKELQNSQLNVSVQFLVDYDGTIYRLMPDTAFARHCIGLNYMAVGIENVGDGNKHPVTDAQVEANAKIVRYLAKKYPIEYLIGHHEYTAFRNSPLWKETDLNYITTKSDPGDEFMKKLRTKVANLHLKSKP